MKRLPLLPMVLTTTALVLAATLVYQIAAPPVEYAVPHAPRRDISPTSLPEPFIAPPLSEFTEIEKRPLFVAERRPFKEESKIAEAPPAPRAPPGLTLVGVIVDGKRRIAIARMGGRSVSLRMGSSIEGWSVVAMEADRIALKSDEETHEIRLPKAVATAPAQAGPGTQPLRTPPPPGYAPGQVPGRP
jgi:hypothetical protein